MLATDGRSCRALRDPRFAPLRGGRRGDAPQGDRLQARRPSAHGRGPDCARALRGADGPRAALRSRADRRLTADHALPRRPCARPANAATRRQRGLHRVLELERWGDVGLQGAARRILDAAILRAAAIRRSYPEGARLPLPAGVITAITPATARLMAIKNHADEERARGPGFAALRAGPDRRRARRRTARRRRPERGGPAARLLAAVADELRGRAPDDRAAAVRARSRTTSRRTSASSRRARCRPTGFRPPVSALEPKQRRAGPAHALPVRQRGERVGQRVPFGQRRARSRAPGRGSGRSGG